MFGHKIVIQSTKVEFEFETKISVHREKDKLRLKLLLNSLFHATKPILNVS